MDRLPPTTRVASGPTLETFGRIQFCFFTLILLYCLTYALLWTQSHQSVRHNIHAVEIGYRQYIHGSQLDCTRTDGGHTCLTRIAGNTLLIEALQFDPRLKHVASCSATFAGHNIPCEPAHVTSHNFAHGVSLSDGALITAFTNDKKLTFAWRSIMLGSSGLAGVFISLLGPIVLPIVAFGLVPRLVDKHSSLLSDSQPFKIYSATLLIMLSYLPAAYILFFMTLELGFFD